MMRSALSRISAFARDVRGGAAIEVALGSVVLVSVCALCFDLYSRIKADAASARLAGIMADYVSRDSETDGDGLKALGKYLYDNQLRVPADVVYAITAFRRPSANPPEPVEMLWSDNSIRFGDAAVTANLASGCARYVAGGGKSGLPAGFDMSAGEVVIVVELCARLTREGSLTGRFISGDIYRHHAVPAREPATPPSKPTYSQAGALPSVTARRGSTAEGPGGSSERIGALALLVRQPAANDGEEGPAS